MSLSSFSLIVSIDSKNGISCRGQIPWDSRGDMNFFRDTTIGNGKNAVVMGRVTYENIPPEFRPLKGRTCVVISRTWKQEDHPEISVCNSLLEALTTLGGSDRYDDVFIVGGEAVYAEVIRNFLYLCDKIYVTKFKSDYECDQFFPWDGVCSFDRFKDEDRSRDYVRHFFLPEILHPEYEYLECLEGILEKGENRPDRTGIGTKSIFGAKMRFDISERIPIITTKKVNYTAIIHELLFFISGKTDTKILEEKKVNIWKGNTSRDFLDGRKLEYEEGDMGPGYGFQWRHWGAEYEGADKDYTGKGIDQLSNLIENIKEDPFSRRHILTCWNVSQLNEMALPPCHMTVQFYVSGDRKFLDCQLYQRSGDMFLGVPFNIASYSILTYMIAHLTNLRPRYFIHIIGDAHIYSNHEAQVTRQIRRTPHPLPTLKFRGGSRIHHIDDFTFDSFIIENYTSWPPIKAEMAV